MRLTGTVILTLLNSATALVARGDASHDQGGGKALEISTTSGKLHGFINCTAPGTRQFLGVPYAEPPLGSLRFQPPQRYLNSHSLDTKAFKPSCKQQTSNSTTIYTEWETQFLINGGDSEDCLYLNVYAPVRPKEEKVPVFIYIPGGGFTSGGANSLYKIPDQWISQSQSHIVVTIKVEWVYYNIAAFGGDPERIVLWGQSAGAMSVATYAYGFHYDPIVKGLIADSGSANDNDFDDTFSSFTTLAGLVSCGGLDADEELSCVQAVDADTLQHLVSTSSSISFRPQADNVTAFASVADRVASGQVAKIPLLTGNNANEGSGFSPSAGETQTGGWQTGLDAIVCPVSEGIALRAQNGLVTYRYEYAGNFSNVSPEPWIGASHSAELPLVFGTHYEYRGNSTDFEWEVSFGMQELWLSFASNSSREPEGGGVTWPKYSITTNTTLLFAADEKVVQFVNGSYVDDLCPTSTCPTCAYFNS